MYINNNERPSSPHRTIGGHVAQPIESPVEKIWSIKILYLSIIIYEFGRLLVEYAAGVTSKP